MAIPAKARTHLKDAGIFLAGAVCVALIGVPTGIYITHRTNTAMVIQQQQLSELQSFELTGGALDTSVGQFSATIASGKGVETARQALGAAIAAHSSSAFVMRDLLGSDYAPYVAKLVELRGLADTAKTPEEGVRTFQALADLIALRNGDSKKVKAKVGAE